jgi:hypothetical protein
MAKVIASAAKNIVSFFILKKFFKFGCTILVDNNCCKSTTFFYPPKKNQKKSPQVASLLA